MAANGAHTSQLARSLRIVIADDDPDAVLMLETLLRDDGHQVRTAYEGRQVMGVVLDMAPDVVILDIKMPGLSGWEVARMVRALGRPGHPLVIGISGEHVKQEDKIMSKVLGFDHYLLKPCDFAELQSLLAPLR